MRLKIAACTLPVGMLIASVFAQAPSTKPDNASQTAPTAQAQQPHRIRVKEDVQKAALVHTVPLCTHPLLSSTLMVPLSFT
jgi:hypothetical protein